jgi:hypothetical protein
LALVVILVARTKAVRHQELERLAVKRVRQMSEGVDPGPGYVDL